jgi:hypothetical protein
MLGCNMDEREPEFVVCPPGYPSVFVLTVDYATHAFLGGYIVGLSGVEQRFEPVCEYQSPGDFGSIAWRDGATGTELFAGTIVWMGKGKRTFPEAIYPPDAFPRLNVVTAMPQMIRISPEAAEPGAGDVDYTSVWKALESLQCVSWIQATTPAYIYLYAPSVGAGDPADWYWVVFLKY